MIYNYLCYCNVMLGFYVPPTTKVMRRRDLGLKSHPKDRKSPGSNSRPQVYKASDYTTEASDYTCRCYVLP